MTRKQFVNYEKAERLLADIDKRRKILLVDSTNSSYEMNKANNEALRILKYYLGNILKDFDSFSWIHKHLIFSGKNVLYDDGYILNPVTWLCIFKNLGLELDN